MIALALLRESATPYATLTPMLEPALVGFTWNNIIKKDKNSVQVEQLFHLSFSLIKTVKCASPQLFRN